MAVSLEATAIDGGYKIQRSDGKDFLLLWKDSGHAVLYRGSDPNNVPFWGLVDLDVGIADKLEAARPHALGYSGA